MGTSTTAGFKKTPVPRRRRFRVGIDPRRTSSSKVSSFS